MKIFRFDPAEGKQAECREYTIPFEKGMSAMDALDYVYQNIDGTQAFYDHAGCCSSTIPISRS